MIEYWKQGEGVLERKRRDWTRWKVLYTNNLDNGNIYSDNLATFQKKKEKDTEVMKLWYYWYSPGSKCRSRWR